MRKLRTVNAVNDDIKQLVRIELARRNMSQKQLAEQIGVSQQYLSDILRNASKGKIPDVWHNIFEEFGWHIVVVDKNGDEVK